MPNTLYLQPVRIGGERQMVPGHLATKEEFLEYSEEVSNLQGQVAMLEELVRHMEYDHAALLTQYVALAEKVGRVEQQWKQHGWRRMPRGAKNDPIF